MGNVNFVTVNINVDGKKETIKVEKGVTFQNIFVDGNKLEKQHSTYFYETKAPKKDWYGYEATAVHCREIVNEVKMTKGEFALLKNIADNNNEGDGIVLSMQDIEIGLNQYIEGQFTKDISKNLPNGYKANRNLQDREGMTSLKACVTKGEKDEYFECAIKMQNPEIRKLQEKSIDGKVYEYGFGDGEWSLEYTGKDGKTYTHNQNTGDIGEVGELYRIEYTDENGVKICKDLYNNTIEKKYEDKNGKNIHEYYDENENLVKYYVSYKDGDKSIEEKYNPNNEMEIKWVKYKNEKNEQIKETHENNTVLIENFGESEYEYTAMTTEEYVDGKLVSRSYASYNEESKNTLKESYDKNGKVTKRYYKDGDISSEEFDKNNRVTKRNFNKTENKNSVGNYKTQEYVYDDNGKVKNILVNIENTTIKFDNNKNLVQVGDFNVQEILSKTELNEDAQEYKKDFDFMTQKEIAKELHSQIYGPSLNKKTLNMFDAIPNEKLLEVLKEYNNIKGFFEAEQDTLLITMADEWGIGISDLAPRLQRIYAVYLNDKKEKLEKNDIEFVQSVLPNETNSDFRTTLAKVEEYATVGKNKKYVYKKDQEPELKGFWYNFKKFFN